jgi:hypothetical protein
LINRTFGAKRSKTLAAAAQLALENYPVRRPGIFSWMQNESAGDRKAAKLEGIQPGRAQGLGAPFLRWL